MNTNIIALLQWTTLGSYVFWLIVYWQAGYKVLLDIRNSIRSKNTTFDAVLMGLMAFLSLIISAIAFLVVTNQRNPFYENSPQSGWISFGGCVLTIAGITGMFYGRYQLGQYWTAETALSSEHQVVDKGFFSIVRHPIYLCAISAYVGFGIVFSAGWNMIFVGMVVLFYILKIKEEEVFLEENLSGYREYQQRVRYRLLPGLW